MYRSLVQFCYLLILCLNVGVAWANPPKAAIATAHPLATEAGFEILAQGGNAFDAAVAVSAALAVVEPYSSGLGGGGFWLVYRDKDKKYSMVDGREKAPAAAHKDLYLDKAGNVVPGLSINGPLSAGIPGVPAALAYITKHYGNLSLKKNLAPAIRLAKQGFKVDKHYRRMANFRAKNLNQSSDAQRIFLRDGKVPPLGYRIRQKELAKTLKVIAAGKNGFYQGRLAELLVEGSKAAGGIWTLEDLANYKVVERKPVIGRYKDTKIIAASPPSSGGIALMTMLNILAEFKLDKLDTSQRYHYIVEAMRRAYRDRAVYLGDPDFVKIPGETLTNTYYAQGLARNIHPKKATESASLPGPTITAGGKDTTHFSILDKDGNRVAATLSINYPFGSCFVPPGTGVLLNDEMDDFSAKPGVPNEYGLVGAEANAIQGGKRPLSSMTPTFLEGPKGVAILGTPGGSRIITMVLIGILSYERGEKPEAWVKQPRFHHQYLPDVIQIEPKALSDSDINILEGMGHKFETLKWQYGNMHAILWDKKAKKVYAASDPRGNGKAMVK